MSYHTRLNTCKNSTITLTISSFSIGHETTMFLHVDYQFSLEVGLVVDVHETNF